MELNFFNLICFAYALFAISTRFFILYFGKRWNEWELSKAYTEEKPKWIYFVGVMAVLIIIYTWYMVWESDRRYTWIVAVLLSLTLIKVGNLVFNYKAFREFASKTLYNRQKMKELNLFVFIFALVLVGLGVFLYS